MCCCEMQKGIYRGNSDALPHRYYHANDVKSAEEFLAVLLDLSAVICGSN